MWLASMWLYIQFLLLGRKTDIRKQYHDKKKDGHNIKKRNFTAADIQIINRNKKKYRISLATKIIQHST